MADLLVFYPQGRHLIIEFLAEKYIDVQPQNDDDMKTFMSEISPIIKELDGYVEKYNLKEIIELNLKNVPISKLNSDTVVKLMNLMTSLRPDKNILEKISITNSNPLFGMLFGAMKSRLSPRVRNIIVFEENSKF